MLQDLLHPETQVPRSPGFWVAAVAVVGAQLVGFWMLCSHQVQRAEARSAETQMAQVALADCLQYIPGSTVATCVQRISPAGATAQASAESPATAVSYSFR